MAAVALAAFAAPAGAQTFEGAYKLTLSFGSGCQARIPSVSVALTLHESTVTRGSEVAGRPARSDEAPVAAITLMRSGSSVHGPFSARGGLEDRDEITSGEGWLFIPWLMLDGSVTAGADRPQARGTAFGFLAAGGPEEDYPSSLGRCTAADFSWALDPQ
jgi:hypothetical protein